MATELILVRHGESIANMEGKFIGQTDWGVSALGFRQAELVGAYLKDRPVDAIYSSDLTRTRQTAAPTARIKGLEPVPDPGLREINAGAWETRKFTALKVEDPEAYGVWLRDLDHAHPTGGESVQEMKARFCAALTRIAEMNEGKTVAVFTHSTPLRVFFAALFGRTAQEQPWLKNASLSRVRYENGAFSVLEYENVSFLGDSIREVSSDV